MKSAYHKFGGNFRDYILSKNVVYCIENKVNGKVYIGVASKLKKRLVAYGAAINSNKKYSNCQYIVRSIKKYQPHLFDFNVIKICKSFDEAKNFEQDFIYNLNILNIEIYNLTEGGDGFLGVPSKSGTDMYNSKFTKDDVLNIFKLYHINLLSSTDIGIKFNCNNSIIINILNAKTYKKLTVPVVDIYPPMRKSKDYVSKSRGSGNYRASLSDKDLENIFHLYYDEKKSTEEIGVLLSRGRSVIHRALRGKTYTSQTVELRKKHPGLRSSTYHLWRK